MWILEELREPGVELLEIEFPEDLPLAGPVGALKSSKCRSSVG